MSVKERERERERERENDVRLYTVNGQLTLQCLHCCWRLTRVALFSNVTASFFINSEVIMRY